jgi:uncharacterized OB-fold protein
MRYGSITSRRCKRCGTVAVGPHPIHAQNTSEEHLRKIPLCAECTKWAKSNPGKVVK